MPAWDSSIVVAITVVAAVAALWGIWWLWWRLPQRQVARLAAQIPDLKERADVEDNFRKTIGQALGGAAVLIGAGAAYLQFTQQQQAARDLLISNQVAKGFEQLAGDKLAMRLGGIYGLEGVMNISEQYHQSVVETLCAFVREGTVGKTVGEKGPATDIQAALTVIGRRKPGEGDVVLAAARIPKATLSGADLSGADLSGADLSRATLVNADLSGADLTNTKLINTDLTGAKLINTDLTDAKLINADLTGAKLINADMSRVDMSRANLNGVDLSGAILSGADLRGADLSGAKLGSAQNLTQLQLDQACGTEATLPPGLTLKHCPPPQPAPGRP